MIVTEKLKDSLKKFMSSRAAAGEGSLKTWGGMQKPPITGSMAEAVADALVKDKVLTKEERASGWVWRKVLSEPAAAPVAAVNDEEQDEEDEEDEDEDEETDDQADEDEDEAPPSAPSAAPVAQPAPERRNASVTPAPAAPVEAPAPPAAALPYSPELISTIVALPEAQWQAVTLARRTLSEARALIARGTALEAEAIKALDRALSGSPEAAVPAPAVAAAAAVQALDAIEGRPPPAGWARTRTVDTGENAGTARDKIMRLFLGQPEKRLFVADIAKALGWSARACSGALSTLVRDEKLERPTTGVYCLSKALARKAALCAP